ncbi:hypothetical protein C2845_PM05G12030 [Panicum miliaceum]|uniref:Uncharacterized protein n=1 Tax=Panicum miliaceum TaxID=4540 RepID=A0A3L6SY71_PANMI|nr:hypothetical protein C2845_PM05G12030 [Panicum miliaceum]
MRGSMVCQPSASGGEARRLRGSRGPRRWSTGVRRMAAAGGRSSRLRWGRPTTSCGSGRVPPVSCGGGASPGGRAAQIWRAPRDLSHGNNGWRCQRGARGADPDDLSVGRRPIRRGRGRIRRVGDPFYLIRRLSTGGGWRVEKEVFPAAAATGGGGRAPVWTDLGEVS